MSHITHVKARAAKPAISHSVLLRSRCSSRLAQAICGNPSPVIAASAQFLWCETAAFPHATVVTEVGLDVSIGKPGLATYLWAFLCISNQRSRRSFMHNVIGIFRECDIADKAVRQVLEAGIPQNRIVFM